MKRKRAFAKRVLFYSIVLCLVAFSAGTGRSATVDVQVVNFQFVPSTVSIQAGDTVRWVWNSAGHTTTSGTDCTPDGMWNSGLRGAGFEFSVTFDLPGTFPYYCIPHCTIGMVGTVVVTAAPPTFNGTGIQIIGLSSNITGTVMAGDTVTFTVTALPAPGVGPLNYKFWRRLGYDRIQEVPPWGGNQWMEAQDWGPNNSASIIFPEPGFYFMAVHFSEDTTWSAAQGGPQTGMVVEVWPTE